MGIALVISFFFKIYLFYLRKIYLHLHIRCVIGVALCILCIFLYARANMPRKAKPSINAQQPKLGPISLEYIQWPPKTRKMFKKLLTILVAFLPLKFASKYTKEDVRNLCLMSPRPGQKWWYLDLGQRMFNAPFYCLASKQCL